MRFPTVLLVLCIASEAWAQVSYDTSLGTLPQAQAWTYSGESNVNGTNGSPFIADGALQETTVGSKYRQSLIRLWTLQHVVVQAVLHVISPNYVPMSERGPGRLSALGSKPNMTQLLSADVCCLGA